MASSVDVVVAIRARDPYFARGLALALAEHGVQGLLPDDEDPPTFGLDDDDAPFVVALLEGTERVRGEHHAVWILDEREEVMHALSNGARGVVLRGIDARSLASALRSVAHGFLVIDPRLDHTFASGANAATERAPVERGPLTQRESEVLHLLAQGLTNKEIAAELGVSAHTAKFHVNGILEKLGAMTRTEAVTIAVRSGLVHL
jgi:two-component system nitrate/nitrite response regulator NarL